MMSKAQITVVELTLAMVLFAGFAVSFGLLDEPRPVDSQAQLDSLANAMLYSDDYRNLTYQEDLSDLVLTENWTGLDQVLTYELVNYELVIGNLSAEKVIESCQGTFYEAFAQRFYGIQNDTGSGLRYFRLGVCY